MVFHKGHSTWNKGKTHKKKIVCETCGVQFEDYQGNRKRFCSKECSDVGNKRTYRSTTKIEVTCHTCGKKTLRFPSVVKNNKGRYYCSGKCYAKNGNSNPHWQGGIPEKTCEVCGEKYKPFRRGKVSESRFCSRKCQGIAHSRELSGENHPLWGGRGKHKIIKCKLCGKEFKKFDSDKSEYCSGKCSRASRKIKKKCVGCHKEFEVLYGKRKQIYCSSECLIRSSKVERICLTCGHSFVTNRNETKKYCSMRCWARARIGDKNSHWQGGDVLIKCVACGIEFGVPKHRHLLSKYCSKKCRAVHYKKLFSKEGNPNWAGGKIKWRGKNWSKQRLRALERDEYRCQLCGSEDVRLEVHHIIPFRYFGIEKYIEANKLSNLKVVCTICHIMIEPPFNYSSSLQSSQAQGISNH